MTVQLVSLALSVDSGQEKTTEITLPKEMIGPGCTELRMKGFSIFLSVLVGSSQ
jgi:dihydroxyacetone kinase